MLTTVFIDLGVQNSLEWQCSFQTSFCSHSPQTLSASHMLVSVPREVPGRSGESQNFLAVLVEMILKASKIYAQCFDPHQKCSFRSSRHVTLSYRRQLCGVSLHLKQSYLTRKCDSSEWNTDNFLSRCRNYFQFSWKSSIQYKGSDKANCGTKPPIKQTWSDRRKYINKINMRLFNNLKSRNNKH